MLKRIEQYDNYREFLREFYLHEKSRTPTFSYRTFCKKAGIKSPSYYKEVVDGKRDLTPNMIDAFARGIKLSARDKQYFKALVGFNQVHSTHEKQIYLEQMHALRRRVSQKAIPVDYYAYFSNWYNPVIRELACIVNWNDDYGLLARLVAPPITIAQARASIELLVALEFIRKNDSGRYEETTSAIAAGKEIQAIALRRYNKMMTDLGGNAIEAFPREEREIRSLTFGISEQGYDFIREEMQCFAERILKIVDDDKKCDRVYTMSLNLFPVSSKNQIGDQSP